MKFELQDDSERDIAKRYKITVSKGCFSDTSTCSHEKCKKHDEYLIFNWDGEPMLSRLFARPCAKHLAEFIDSASEDNKKTMKKQILDRRKKRFNEALKMFEELLDEKKNDYDTEYKNRN